MFGIVPTSVVLVWQVTLPSFGGGDLVLMKFAGTLPAPCAMRPTYSIPTAFVRDIDLTGALIQAGNIRG